MSDWSDGSLNVGGVPTTATAGSFADSINQFSSSITGLANTYFNFEKNQSALDNQSAILGIQQQAALVQAQRAAGLTTALPAGVQYGIIAVLVLGAGFLIYKKG